MTDRTQYQRIRTEIELYLKDRGEAKYLSPVAYRNWSIVFDDFFPRVPSGKLLDIGSANASYKKAITDKFETAIFVDVNHFPNSINIRGDGQNLPIRANSFDVVLCLQLFEHLKRPNDAIKEVYRILKKGGILILSVPHLSRLHEIPNDYYRFTQFGLQELLREGQFEILNIEVTGGLLLFLSHQFSLAFLLLFWRYKWLRELAVWINKNLIVKPILWVDSKISKNTRFPQGYVLMAKKM